MQAKHTPGPWTYSADDKLNGLRAFGINRDLGKEAAEERGVDVAIETIAEVCEANDHAIAEADARLIAAAPDLLEACKQAFEELGASAAWRVSTLRLDVLRKAIAKATGTGA